MNEERLQYLPPVDSLMYAMDPYYHKENLRISDHKSENSFSGSNSQSATSSYFWIYNASNKGPKKRYNVDIDENSFDPLSLTYEDPIKEISQSGKSAKRRKSEANCTMPNLQNFIKIGNNIFRSTQSYKHVMQNEGRISPKQRNILASKICRLKKKAYHESLKIKYTALGIEYCEIIKLLDWIDNCKKMLFPMSVEIINKKIDEIHVIRAAGRLNQFIMGLVTGMNKDFRENPQIMKLSTFNPDEEPIYKFEFSLSGEIDVDNELDFLVEAGFIDDFLNSSGSTSFSDDFV